MHLRHLIAISTAAVVFSAITAFAQPGGGQGMPRYDKATETTLTGTVDEVQAHQGRMGGTGTHLLFQTGTGAIDVHVGPTNWLSSKKFTFAKGDHLEILGSKVTIDGKDAFIAREIKKGETTMVLRNQNGIPAWSGGGRGMPRSGGGACCMRP